MVKMARWVDVHSPHIARPVGAIFSVKRGDEHHILRLYILYIFISFRKLPNLCSCVITFVRLFCWFKRR